LNVLLLDAAAHRAFSATIQTAFAVFRERVGRTDEARTVADLLRVARPRGRTTLDACTEDLAAPILCPAGGDAARLAVAHVAVPAFGVAAHPIDAVSAEALTDLLFTAWLAVVACA
jgi:hypothetical protein